MNNLLIWSSLLLAIPGHIPLYETQTDKSAVASPVITPVEAHENLCNDAASLLRRAMKEANDSKALVILQGKEAAQINERWHHLQPQFHKWLTALPAAQRQAYAQRMVAKNGLMQYMQSVEHDTKLNARIEHNPKLAAEIMKLAAMAGGS